LAFLLVAIFVHWLPVVVGLIPYLEVAGQRSGPKGGSLRLLAAPPREGVGYPRGTTGGGGCLGPSGRPLWGSPGPRPRDPVPGTPPGTAGPRREGLM